MAKSGSRKCYQDEDDFVLEPRYPRRTNHAKERQRQRNIHDGELWKLADRGIVPRSADGKLITVFRENEVLCTRTINPAMIGHFVGKGRQNISRNFPGFRVYIIDDIAEVHGHPSEKQRSLECMAKALEELSEIQEKIDRQIFRNTEGKSLSETKRNKGKQKKPVEVRIIRGLQDVPNTDVEHNLSNDSSEGFRKTGKKLSRRSSNERSAQRDERNVRNARVPLIRKKFAEALEKKTPNAMTTVSQ